MIADGLTGDVLVLTGGVSVGEYDLVGAALIEAGCEVLFHNVSMRPGKPILAAKRGGCLVLGLPGNPVSAFTGFHVFVAPALRKLMGDPAPVAPPLRATPRGGASSEARAIDLPPRAACAGRTESRSWRPSRAPARETFSPSSAPTRSSWRPATPSRFRQGAEVDVLPWD